jgi:hypothetical protein
MSYTPKYKSDYRAMMVAPKGGTLGVSIPSNCHSITIRLNPASTGTLTIDAVTVLNPGQSVTYSNQDLFAWIVKNFQLAFTQSADSGSVVREYISEMTREDIDAFQKTLGK